MQDVSEGPLDLVHELDLGSGDSQLPWRQNATSGGTIIVTKSYSNLYNRILTHRESIGGVAITGQPGIGKTTFLKYILARLLSEKQVVILYTTEYVFLFYQQRVYYHPEVPGVLSRLPRTRSKHLLWMLVDMDFVKRGPHLGIDLHVWPILASSPNRERWIGLTAQYDVRVWGMELWTREELISGLRLHPRYDLFIAELKKAWPTRPQGNASPPTMVRAAVHRAVAVLESARAATAREMADAKGDVSMSSNDEDYRMADATPSTINQSDTVDGALETPVDHATTDALKTLIDDAITEVGYAPRGVYAAILDSKRHDDLPPLTFKQLCDIIFTFHDQRYLDAKDSHRIIAVYPQISEANSADNDSWKVDFVSAQVALQVMHRMAIQEHDDLRFNYHLYASVPGCSTFAGWITELYAHRYLSGELGAALPVRLPMVQVDSGDAPRFTFTPPDHALSAPTGHPLRFERTIVDLSLPLERTIVDDEPRYYEPAVPHNPLFDSFTISCDKEQNSAVISIFQITKSRKHGGSQDGYPIIRKIMACVCMLLQHDVLSQKRKVKLTLEYVLVRPSPPQGCSWQMPVGWSKYYTRQDHPGKVYCLHLPV
ncbi:hypothetical protein C8Q80DRAFT_1274537 [Daedaleopsis nitida]|nr:hypothetical protein C8Q80DRAFT_1274537 [Daedaleopsis nitida]